MKPNGDEMAGSTVSGNSKATPRRTKSGTRAGLWIAALLLACVVTVTGAIALEAEDAFPPPEINRDAVWRAIFKRPDGLPDPKPDLKQAALGRRLFNDPRLSGGGDMACATCHQEGRAFTDGRPLGRGRGGVPLDRNVPMLLNLAWGTSFFWDGRAASLEEQARGPLLAPNEMAGDLKTMLATLDADAETKALFADAFPGPDPLREETLLRALAAYERTLVSGMAPFDRWVAGDDAALNDEQRQGFAIFVGKGGCVSCHGGWRLTDDARHDIGLGTAAEGARGFKTPSLREVSRTGPYMHDGSLPTLRAVVDHYAGNLRLRPTLANNVVRNLSLTEGEKQSLVLFLETLSSDAKK